MDSRSLAFRIRTHSQRLTRTLNKNPHYYGIGFILLIVGASYGMVPFAQTRYDVHDRIVKTVSKEEKLGMDRNRKEFDIRDAYFRLAATIKSDKDWDPSAKRIERPKGLAEWGEAPENPPVIPQHRLDPEPKRK